MSLVGLVVDSNAVVPRVFSVLLVDEYTLVVSVSDSPILVARSDYLIVLDFFLHWHIFRILLPSHSQHLE